MHAKIQNDAFRTFQSDPLFRRRVTQNSITRLLNAAAWRLHDAHEARVHGWQSPRTLSDADGASSTPPPSSHRSRASVASAAPSPAAAARADLVGYVQGMNVLAGPFLYAARSEVQAFVAFERLVTRECPGYVRASMDGVHKGLGLVDTVLEIVDPKLFAHLMARGMHAEIYAFASVLTMCACTPPLREVLQLWDFLFAYGPHLNILCIVAQLVLIRDQIMGSPRCAPRVAAHRRRADAGQPEPDSALSASPPGVQDHSRGNLVRWQDPAQHLRRHCEPRQMMEPAAAARPGLHWTISCFLCTTWQHCSVLIYPWRYDTTKESSQ